MGLPMSLTEADYRLSMGVSQRRRHGKERLGLRSMLIHRLRPAPKAILRLSNSRSMPAPPEEFNVFCERCGQWVDNPDWADDWTCPGCGTLYATEMVIFSAIEQEDSSERHADAAAPWA
jgi:hypothetical protein